MNSFYPLIDARLIRPGSRVAVAVSGGADSVALLRAVHGANTLNRKALGVGLSAIHVHHGIRGEEADLDLSFVEELCSRLDVPLTVRRVSVTQHREATGETVEEAARTLRYQVFHAIMAEDGVEDILTAHTRDDQAETVLMKLLRGAWTEGLGGIHPVLSTPFSGKRILRPMLCTPRSAVVDYLHQLGQTWREDSSNLDPAYTRNRIRHQVLPLLRSENPSLDETLANLAELAREDEDRWQKELSRLLPQLLLPGSPVRGGGRSVSTASASASVSLDIERLRTLDASTRRRVLRAAARSLNIGDSAAAGVRLSFDETARLLALCGLHPDPTVSARPGTVLTLSQQLVARRSPRELQLTLQPQSIPAKTRSRG